MRFKITIEYLGTNFSGWQIQPDARTVEGELEKAFTKILQQKTDLVGQGRTDAGVHAKGQVAHFDVDELNDPEKLIFGVNGLIGDEVQIKSIEKVHDEFHSRFDASKREYEYTILKSRSPLRNLTSWVAPRNYNPDKLYECANLLSGEFDFSGFSKFNEENFTTLCTIHRSEFEEFENEFIYKISANRFLRNMVRRIVGTMMEVATGKLSVKEFEELLKNPDGDTKTFTAPAKGLVLKKVFY